MMLAIQTHYVFPPSVPTVAVYLLAAFAIAAWVAAHWFKRRMATGLWRAAWFAARVVIGFLTMLAVAQALQRGLVLATNWPIWPIALVGALAVEIVLALYAMERRTVSRRMGLALAALRVALVALVIIMLTQPVRPWTLDKTIQRYVAVLLDNSASMYVPDTQLGASEKMRLAERFAGGSVTRPYHMDRVADQMDQIRSELAAQVDWLATLSSAKPDERRRQLEARRDALNKAMEGASKKVLALATDVGTPLDARFKLDERLRATAEDLAKRLTALATGRLKEAASLTSKENVRNLEPEHARLVQTISQSVSDLADLASRTVGLGQSLDEAFYAALPPETKARADSFASEKRISLARDILAGAGGSGSSPASKGPGLLAQLQKKYSVIMYNFAAKPVEVNLKEWAAASKEVEGSISPTALPAEQQQTDLAAALEKVMSEMADKQLSGIVLLSDGRHNGARSPEPLVRRLGSQQVPVSCIVLGGDKPPLDAGIISVDAPETVATKDRMLVQAEVKLDGLAGKEVRVTLADGAKTVDTQTVRVPTDAYRTRVQLADEPSASGLHKYAVEVQKFEGEVLANNNQYPIAVSVTDERTKMLIIEGRPRWEFRYLKNLFESRDRTVRLQYVLLEPDRIESVPPPRKAEASVSRPIGEVEATALPKDEAEWMKFDVIVLGDVAPKYLKDEELKILRKFVTERAGTLVVIAGPQNMPHAYADTPLADLLPVTFKMEAVPQVPSPEKSFRLALTAEGLENVIMRQKTNPEENAAVWESIPEIYWRHPVLRTKEGATVLAYALPTSPPDFMPKKGAAASEKLTDQVLRQRRDFERQNPLIVYHSVSMGQVMFLAFDHTWRLRYRIGDTYHHRFWGQVLRWATAGKLPSGTDTVKLGTDRARYAPQAPVRVRAKIARKDFTPIVSDEVSVNVFDGDKLILTKKMKYIEHSPGLYNADLGELPGGAYRVELVAPAAKAVLEEDHVSSVSTEFTVDPSTPVEQAELVPDRGLLARMANLTGGAVAEPSRADRILESLGPPSQVEVERHEFVLWDSWPLLILMVMVATGEWLLRKKGGLA